jgi:hypothetical protein
LLNGAGLEVVFAERAGVAAADVAGAEVVQALQVGAAAGEVEDVAGALDLDPHAKVARHGQVVSGG